MSIEQLWSGLNAALGLEVEGRDLSVWQMSLRAFIVFLVAIFMIRLGNKRFMGQSTTFDVMLGIVFGSVVSRAINGSAPFFPTLGVSIVLVFLHWVLSAVTFHSHRLGTIFKGRDTVLVRDGKMEHAAMRRSHITEHDLKEALRNHGKHDNLSLIEEAHLERNGDISLILHEE